MSVSISAFTILGIPCKREDFFDLKGSNPYCFRCDQHHTSMGSFCTYCGGKVGALNVWDPKPALVKLAQERKMDPEDLYDQVTHNAARSQSSVSDGTFLVLGIQLMKSEDHESSDSNPYSIPFTQVAEGMAELVRLASKFWIDGTPQLYLCTYASV